jgi:methylthioribose-1-phosphate isomerase
MRLRFEALRPAGGAGLRQGLLEEALAIRAEDLEACRRMGDLGAELLPAEARLLTHCNAGALATAGYGTALGVVRSAARLGKVKMVYADETRPWLQGARLTAWELLQDGIPVTLIADNMAGHLMARGEIDVVVVGSDRIAANGDVANKIGTYTVAVLAKEHGIPFYVAAPVSTFDLATPAGAGIPIEERPAEEVTHVAGRRIAPEGVLVRNPAFDVTPHRYVTAIVCERGVARPPFTKSLRALAGGARAGRLASWPSSSASRPPATRPRPRSWRTPGGSSRTSCRARPRCTPRTAASSRSWPRATTSRTSSPSSSRR